MTAIYLETEGISPIPVGQPAHHRGGMGDEKKAAEAEAEADRDVDDATEQEKAALYSKIDAVELTPAEAFSWNVEGDQSPFPKVAACVPNTDDPDIPCSSRSFLFLCCSFMTPR